MFLDAVILFLQEILEASLLISVLLALTEHFHRISGRDFQLPTYWVFYAVLFGGIGAWGYAVAMPTVSEWFDYVGLEVVNSLLNLLSLLLLLVLATIVPSSLFKNKPLLRNRIAVLSMVIIVLLALMREGSEIILYLNGVMSQAENTMPVLSGGVIGTGIGISSGIFLYYSLISLKQRWSMRACVLLLALFAGNMASQVVTFLSQADWLPYSAEAWNYSALIPEGSLPGRLLYALVGYEATPSILQVTCYGLAVMAILIGPLFRRAWWQKDRLQGSV
jgi:high-affinity iron transporter